MTSLINIPSEMRQRINARLYTTSLCIQHLGNPNPGPAEIRNWKEGWKLDHRVNISSISKAQNVIKQQEIPQLLYDIRSNNSTSAHNRFVVFYEEEDYILFKLLYDNT